MRNLFVLAALLFALLPARADWYGEWKDDGGYWLKREAVIDSVRYNLYFHLGDGSVVRAPYAVVIRDDAYQTMTHVTIPDCVMCGDTVFAVRILNWDAFNGCTRLQSIKLGENVGQLFDKALYNTGLKELSIPNSVYYVVRCFYSPDLERLEVGKNFPFMDEWTLADAFPKMKHLVWNAKDCIGSGATITGGGSGNDYEGEQYDPSLRYWIGYHELYANDRTMPECLEMVVLGEDVEAVPFGFAKHTAIKAVTIPAGVRKIRPFAFAECPALTAIHAASTSPADIVLENNVVGQLAKNTAITLYVPRGTAALYREAPQWRNFGDRIVEEEYNIDVNQDGLADIDDANATVNRVLEMKGAPMLSTDYNRDGVTDIADVNIVLRELLSK